MGPKGTPELYNHHHEPHRPCVPSLRAPSTAATTIVVELHPPPWRATHRPPSPKVSGGINSPRFPRAPPPNPSHHQALQRHRHAGQNRPPSAAMVALIAGPFPEIKGGINPTSFPLPFPPDSGRRSALGRRRGPPPMPQAPLHCSASRGRGKSGHFALKPLPFSLFLKESLPFLAILQKKPFPFSFFQNKPSPRINLFLNRPLTFPE